MSAEILPDMLSIKVIYSSVCNLVYQQMKIFSSDKTGIVFGVQKDKEDRSFCS